MSEESEVQPVARRRVVTYPTVGGSIHTVWVDEEILAEAISAGVDVTNLMWPLLERFAREHNVKMLPSGKMPWKSATGLSKGDVADIVLRRATQDRLP